MASTSASQESPPFKNDGYLWECIKQKSKPNEPGVDYVFKYRAIFDANRLYLMALQQGSAGDAAFRIKELSKEQTLNTLETIFPAIELTSNKIKKTYLFNNVVLNLLGYKAKDKEDGCYITLPDKDKLESRWKSLQQLPEYSYLPNLTITSCEDTASDEEILKAFMESDVLVSANRKWIHDQQFHVMRVLYMKSNSNKVYTQIRSDIRVKVQTALAAIEMAREKHLKNIPPLQEEANLLIIMKHSLSIVVDILLAAHNTQKLMKLTNHWWNENLLTRLVWSHEVYRRNLEKLGITNVNDYPAEKIQNYWHKIKTEYIASFCIPQQANSKNNFRVHPE